MHNHKFHLQRTGDGTKRQREAGKYVGQCYQNILACIKILSKGKGLKVK